MKTQSSNTPTFVILSPCARWATGPKPFDRLGEALDYKTDKTISDDSFTIAELFNRYRRGEPMPQGLERSVSFSSDPSHGDPDTGRISRMDITEVNALLKSVRTQSEALQARQKVLTAASAPPANEAAKEPLNPATKG